ncbi:hypothetical protein H0N99_04880 [Candidatus Micrarchaeota archaeon]|nr:hypothetical protein [Candidatus Micrarchaeota archaeon]
MAIKVQAALESEATYAEFVMKRKDDEWSGTAEEKVEKETRNRTLNVKYVKGGGADLTETTRYRNAQGEVGTVVKKMHINPGGRAGWADIEFIFGGWKYPIHIEVQKEDERIDKSSPDIVKTDFGTKKIEGRTKLFSGKGTILGSQQDSIYATLSNKDNLICYTETIDGAISATRITIHLERRYNHESKALESISADISVADGVAKLALDASLHIDSEKDKFLNFLSQQPVDSWRREMELRTGNLG